MKPERRGVRPSFISFLGVSPGWVEVGLQLSRHGCQPQVILQERRPQLSCRIAAPFRVPESKRSLTSIEWYCGVTRTVTDSGYGNPLHHIGNITPLVPQPPQDLPRCGRPIGVVPIEDQVIVYGSVNLVVRDHFLSQVLHHCVPQTANLVVEDFECPIIDKRPREPAEGYGSDGGVWG